MEATNGLVLAGAPELPTGYFYRVSLHPDVGWCVQIRRRTGWGFSRKVAVQTSSALTPTINELAFAARSAYHRWVKYQMRDRTLVGDYK